MSDYYDRSYLRKLPESAAGSASLDAQTVSSVALRRQSSFADISFVWKLLQIPGASRRPSTLRFARDYSFRDLKANNAVLVGNSRSNPWVEPFEPKLGIRWTFDKAAAVYDPVDTWTGKSYQARNPGDPRESFFSVALLPNLGGTGNVLIISGTGGSAINAGADSPTKAYSTFHPLEVMTFNWSPVSTAASYVLQVSKDPSFPTTTTASFNNIPNPTYSFSTPDEGTYSARVFAVSANGVAGVPFEHHQLLGLL